MLLRLQMQLPTSTAVSITFLFNEKKQVWRFSGKQELP